jgi:hypothetical protein
MRLSDLTPIADRVFELERGYVHQKLDNEDIVQLLFGGIQTAFTSKEFAEDDDV